jgi:hypothetical protein
VVSQFTCLLSIIQPILSESGVNWTRLDGSMSIRDRLAVIEEFQNPGKGTPTVLLLSLRAGNFYQKLNCSSENILAKKSLCRSCSCINYCSVLKYRKNVYIFDKALIYYLKTTISN